MCKQTSIAIAVVYHLEIKKSQTTSRRRQFDCTSIGRNRRTFDIFRLCSHLSVFCFACFVSAKCNIYDSMCWNIYIGVWFIQWIFLCIHILYRDILYAPALHVNQRFFIQTKRMSNTYGRICLDSESDKLKISNSLSYIAGSFELMVVVANKYELLQHVFGVLTNHCTCIPRIYQSICECTYICICECVYVTCKHHPCVSIQCYSFVHRL